MPVMVSSIRWAAHPAIREMANMGVYRSAGIPSILYTNPEYMSTLAQMALSLVLKSRKISGVSRSINVKNWEDEGQVADHMRKILRKEAGDGSGLIYGMGHAVYTISDPREVILKQRARHLAYEKGFEEEYNMLCSIERLAPGIFAEEKGSTKPVCANVDLFSGLIYNMLGISEDIYTPLFAIARVPGWCAHRVEEVIFANRIIRPAYKYLGVRQKYKPIEER